MHRGKESEITCMPSCDIQIFTKQKMAVTKS